MLRVRCSPTEYRIWQRGYGRDAIPSYICAHLCHLWEVLLCQKFPCVPCVLWESLSSHGFHRFTQMLRVRFVPTESTESTEFGSVGMAGMPYPPTSVNIRAVCGRLFSARGSVSSVLICGRLFSARSFCAFRAFCGNIFSPTDFTDLHRYLGCAVLPQNSQNPQNLAAWVWQGCHTLLHLCASVSSVGGSSLQEVLCIRCIPWELLHRLSVGAAETAAPPGGIHGSSAHISPPHHLTTTTPFHLEPSLLHVLPVLWVRLRHHLRLVDAQPREHNRRRCERHRHAVVVVRVDRL